MLVFGIQDVVVKLCWLLRKSGFGCGGLKAEIGSEIKIMGFCGKTIFSTTVSLGKGWKGPSKGHVVPEVQENNIDLGEDGSGFIDLCGRRIRRKFTMWCIL